MVDLLGMFRRRPAKRGPAGFARPRGDITTLGDPFGDMLSTPVRDAPPIARDGSAPTLDLPPPETERPPHPLAPKKSATATKSRKAQSSGPQLLRRPGFLAVHSVEKSFGTRQVVRGVSRRWWRVV